MGSPGRLCPDHRRGHQGWGDGPSREALSSTVKAPEKEQQRGLPASGKREGGEQRQVKVDLPPGDRSAPLVTPVWECTSRGFRECGSLTHKRSRGTPGMWEALGGSSLFLSLPASHLSTSSPFPTPSPARLSLHSWAQPCSTLLHPARPFSSHPLPGPPSQGHGLWVQGPR